LTCSLCSAPIQSPEEFDIGLCIACCEWANEERDRRLAHDEMIAEATEPEY
jgi:hypothetical protein